MEPIPLRSLTVLLNYERCKSDPNYRGRKLLTTSLIDPDLPEKAAPKMVGLKGRSITKTHVHVYDSKTSNDASVIDTPAVQVSTEVNPAITSLSFKQREVIYYETRGLDGCYQALSLYQHFFSLCPADQLVSIQMPNETPFLIPASSRNIIEFTVHDPKLFTLSTVNATPHTTITGSDQASMHGVLGFPKPGSGYIDVVVDMARMQWGEEGRGSLGEIYWMGSIEEFGEAAGKVCGYMKPWGDMSTHVGPGAHDERLRKCAERVLEKWNKRAEEGWCAYCGVGGKDLRKCAGCVENPIWYCAREHQVADWKLHKFTCEKRKKT